MKKRYIFDTISQLPKEVDSDTIGTVEGFDTENVRSMVMNAVQSKKSQKPRRNIKKIGITLIAAVIAAVSVGTVGAGAMGAFNEAFSEHFAGEKINGVYPGGNVQISTNENCKAELIGIAGDKDDIISAVTFKNTDGNPFVDYDDIENTYVSYKCNSYFTDFGVVEGVKYENDIDNPEKDKTDTSGLIVTADDYSISHATKSAWTEMMMKLNNDFVWDDSYAQLSLTDKNTITANYYLKRYSSGNNDYSLSGETMTVDHDYIYIFHDEKLLYETDVNLYINNGGAYYDFNKASEEAKAAVNAVKDQLKENQIIRRHLSRSYKNPDSAGYKYGKVGVYVSTYKKIKVNFSGSWKLNYKPMESYEIKANSDTLSFEGTEFKVGSIKAEDFGLTIRLSVDTDISQWIDKISFADINITLKNGEKVTGVWSSNNTKDDGILEMELFYCKYDDKSDYSEVWVYVNPEEVQTIEIGGNIFTAE